MLIRGFFFFFFFLFFSCVSLPCWNERTCYSFNLFSFGTRGPTVVLKCHVLKRNIDLWGQCDDNLLSRGRTVINVVMSLLIIVAVVSLQIQDQDQDKEKVSVLTFHSQEAQIWLDVFSWRWSADSCFELKAVRFSHKHATSCSLWKKRVKLYEFFDVVD